MKDNVSFKLAANEWVIKARWFYIIGITLVCLMLNLSSLLKFNSDNWTTIFNYPILFVLAIALLTNTLLYIISRMIDLETAHKHVVWLSFLQIVAEIGLIAFLLFDLNGGVYVVPILFFIPIVESIVLFGHLGPMAVAIFIGIILNTLTFLANSGLVKFILSSPSPNGLSANTIFTWSLVLSVVYLVIGTVSTYISKQINDRQRELEDNVAHNEEQLATLQGLNKELEKEERSLKSKDYELETANKRLQALEEAKSKFVAVTAHQLRTPLSAIKWTFDMILGEKLGPITGEQKEFLAKGFESSQRMIKIVNDLLHVDQMEADKVEYQFTSFDLPKLLDSVAFEFSNQAISKEIKFEIEKPNSNLPQIEGDENKLRVVLENLIDNAVKYTPKGGRVTITLSDKNINSAGRMVDIIITDSGIGIPKAEQSKIFGKFFRAGNAIRIEPDGSGIGLYISKDIIEKHGGSLSYENASGEGTIFHLALPLKQKSL